ncbi:MAG TPA: threonine/serine dehydratase [Actinomycetota bacterium]|nr:threonine/serine dehydratase [Actinomycetota bacterium]
MTEWVIPTLDDVHAAQERIAPHLPRTPMYHYPALDELTRAETWVKHENHLPSGAFKIRGGINLMSKMSPEERRTPVIAASTGNHGQSIAYAAQLFGLKAIICVPEDANAVKLAAMERSGAEIVMHGVDFDDAREHCEKLAEANGYRYIHSGDEPDLIAGVGTYTVEILDEVPDIEVIIVPIGGGSGAAGTAIVAKATRPEIRVIGVQSAAAPAAWRSWKGRELVEDKMGTAAEGLATRTAFELPQRILWDLLDDFVLVEEEQLQAADFHMIERTRNLVELAGAAPLAAAMSTEVKPQIAGKKIALICSGANITPQQLRSVLERNAGQ